VKHSPTLLLRKGRSWTKEIKKCIFLGYDSHHRGYRIYSPSYKSVFISRDVKFNELPKEFASNEVLMKNETWDLVPYPNEKNVTGNKWIYKVKFNSVRDIEKYKARLVAKGFAQKYDIDYEETFDLVVKMPTMRIILALFVAQGWKVFQLDVKSAFLNGDLDVEIFMNQPKGFIMEGKDSFVCKLNKSLYGLK